eukprot:11205786-Lingulodinium_polyedra.AAC.1
MALLVPSRPAPPGLGPPWRIGGGACWRRRRRGANARRQKERTCDYRLQGLGGRDAQAPGGSLNRLAVRSTAYCP